MSEAWYRDASEENLHELHVTNPPQYLTPQQVFEKTGVRLIKVENCEDEEVQARVRQEGGYKFFDFLDISREALPDYDERLEKFYAEHLHEDDEIRLITAGSGFFEIRDHQDRWIRLHVKKGDLIQLPAGIYHRLTLDPHYYIKMLRLYKDHPKWQAVNRPEGDQVPSRKSYLQATPLSVH